MEPTATEHAQNAVFAATAGARRHWLTRWAIIGGAALLAAWLTSLALGILAGYDGLPVLPSLHSGNTHHASSTAPAHRAVSSRRAASTQGTQSGSSRSGGGGSTHRRRSSTTAKPVSSPSHGGNSSSQGQGAGTSSTGKPVGSPGNGPGGSGAPGQLR
jgi:hypothetical protein